MFDGLLVVGVEATVADGGQARPEARAQHARQVAQPVAQVLVRVGNRGRRDLVALGTQRCEFVEDVDCAAIGELRRLAGLAPAA